VHEALRRDHAEEARRLESQIASLEVCPRPSPLGCRSPRRVTLGLLWDHRRSLDTSMNGSKMRHQRR
jgi:hypothetical protein